MITRFTAFVASMGLFGIIVFYVLAPFFWLYGLFWAFSHHHIILALIDFFLPPLGALAGLGALLFG